MFTRRLNTVHTTQIDLQIQYNLYQMPNGIFLRIEKTTLKLIWNHKESFTAKTVLKENKAGGVTLLTSKYITNL